MTEERDKREKRKDEHIGLALSDETPADSHFDQLSFVHTSLPEIRLKDVDLQVNLPDFVLETPFYINAMTGGSSRTGTINKKLAEVARATGLAMAVGSQHAGLRNEQLAETYTIVRKANPKGILFANVGADASPEFALKAVEMIEANALQIHLNAPQELIMPEGERDFSGWLERIEYIQSRVRVPVIVKEVGFGMSRETIARLHDAGVAYVDVSGRGGTNFIGIENKRRIHQEYAYLENWGQTTAISLVEAQEFMDRLTVFASGGIRNPLDAVKCLSLGARAIGLASLVLRAVMDEGTDFAIAEIEHWQEQVKTICTMLGARNPVELTRCPLVIGKEVREWCEARGIDWRNYASRK
ncbi:type 2 isopentenyl-diphosphate Delta-isomerase [Bacillus sp. FJAT-27225]|uniref:type 2 isopentenyl-diphosphate Delta-isomerase n=1 Tax=Bacillus sp. FJAT-27225 TaxID=1743144 RepID=UPI00080C22CD|nr:type 2 isopentenyl-diphosphate Delta-isomerase [Bacillus sp. FJAT-27225]OCA83120.1 type 2 isopentenyl-diphosphate Delta-isomerase [Bacillus sp. FJAT-27225]